MVLNTEMCRRRHHHRGSRTSFPVSYYSKLLFFLIPIGNSREYTNCQFSLANNVIKYVCISEFPESNILP